MRHEHQANHTYAAADFSALAQSSKGTLITTATAGLARSSPNPVEADYNIIRSRLLAHSATASIMSTSLAR